MTNFSVVTSLYNSDLFLENYFRTVFNQKLIPDEVILIDDTLNSENLCKIINSKKKYYNFNKIFLIKNKKNLGHAISLNKGISLSKNNLIFRLDVDDLWQSNHTLEMLRKYKENPNYLIYANSIKNRSFLTKVKCDDYLINENHLIHSSWLINRNICKTFRYHMLKPSLGLEDYFTLLYYSKKYKFYFDYTNTAIYTNFNINSHGRTSRKKKNYLRIRNKISRIFFYLQIKDKNLFQRIYFVIVKFNFLRFIIFLFLYFFIIE
jgi:glycosyltransferase involved in cell wall biosynthesis